MEDKEQKDKENNAQMKYNAYINEQMKIKEQKDKEYKEQMKLKEQKDKEMEDKMEMDEDEEAYEMSSDDEY